MKRRDGFAGGYFGKSAEKYDKIFNNKPTEKVFKEIEKGINYKKVMKSFKTIFKLLDKFKRNGREIES